jgi:trimethylamine--corrinoid protein Co-methyltransferase
MALNGFVRTFKPLEILTEEQVEAIHRAVLDVLENTGVKMQHPDALRLFEANGAMVDYESEHVWIPPALAEESLRRAPSSFRMRARDPKNDLIVGGNSSYFVPFPGMQSLDLATWEQRTVSRREYYEGVTILDALENVHAIENYTPYFGFEEVPPIMAIPEGVAAQIRNTSKCIFSIGRSQGCEKFIIQIANELDIEISSGSAASAPLTFSKDELDCMFSFVRGGFPFHVTSSVILGSTAPATIAGAVVSASSEIMAGIVLTQLIKPGARVMAWNFALEQNMRSGAPGFGSIGNCLHQTIFNQVWRKYNIPVVNLAPGPSSSKKIDFQCGYEKTIGALSAVLSGAHVVLFHGCVYGELTFHPIQAILDDDVAGMIGRFLEGVQVTPESLALELIGQVGPIPGFYLDKQHTRDWWKKEHFLPKAADTQTYPGWLQSGKKDCLSFAKERMEEILSTHSVSIPLSEEQDNKIEAVLSEARDYYRSKDLL